MQPPPRKVKHSAVLKTVHSEQVSKLQQKHQQECDLLEDIRSFARQKSILEKEYAQSLLKLTSGLLKREFPAMPDLTSEDGEEHRTALAVWRVILEETEKIAKARLQAAELYMDKVAEPAKPLKAAKIQCHKKVIPQLIQVQKEVAQSVLEMTNSHKTYNTDEVLAHDARVKAMDANDKLSRRSTGLFQSMSSLQKTASKLTARRETCEAKSILSRNEYLLNMAAANAHQIEYYNNDLPELIKALDGDMYSKIRDFFTLIGSAALEVSTLEKNAQESIVSQAKMIDQQYNYKCFLYMNNIFTNLVQYEFEPCQNDECNRITKDNGAELQLEKEARKWATKIAKENKMIQEYNRSLKGINAPSPEAVSANSLDSPTEVEQQLEEVRFCLRKAETAKAKAEARIEALKQADVNVDEWLASAQAECLRAEEEMSRTPSQMSVNTVSSGGKSEDHEPTYTHYDDDDDFIDDTFEISKVDSQSIQEETTSHFPMKCRAIYDFQGGNADELDMKEGEVLEIVSDGDGDGWVRARSSAGSLGFIPQNYIQILDGDQSALRVSMTESYPPPFEEGYEADSDIVPQNVPAIEVEPGDNDHKQEVTSYSSSDIEVQMTTSYMSPDQESLPPPPDDGCVWARALYDYTAMADEEISFTEGSLIKILRKDENGVDDGFWEGELNGRIGVFPSIVVQEVVNGLQNQMASPDENYSHPDFFPPPPVTITAATPDVEELPRQPAFNATSTDDNAEPSGISNQQYYRRNQHYDKDYHHRNHHSVTPGNKFNVTGAQSRSSVNYANKISFHRNSSHATGGKNYQNLTRSSHGQGTFHLETDDDYEEGQVSMV